jgi:hypothetical protein
MKITGILLFLVIWIAAIFLPPLLVQYCVNEISALSHSDFRITYWLAFGCWIVLGMIGGMFRVTVKSSS